MKETRTTTITTAAEKLENLAAQVGTLAGSLAALENSLYFASERQDRDMTRPCADLANILEDMAHRLQLDIMQIGEDLAAA